MGRKPTGKPPGPPPKQINFDEFEKLCGIQATLEEIAAYFNVSADTIEHRVKEHYGMKFTEVFAQKRGLGRISLRRTQYQAALKGNSTMMVWLGKQYLGQSEKQEIKQEISGSQSISLDHKNVLDMVREIIKEGKK